ncbi:efflux RND transporter periplasmic adaptor subunit [Sediminimonas qiaohouensis]|uniref:efflux RND transporter periplasmic adaptor subunit n=1 Tax=Sediminimonas qiaohouensis TaxID=552061 RepID=UPI0003FDA5E2|nr:efflux RND transporter periplasmic adaptor subunit [Sediminimonas qiaohouensis]
MTALFSALRQLVLIVLLIGVAAWGWITYVPGAAEWLNRTGLPAALGVDVAAEQQPKQSSSSASRRSQAVSVVLDTVTSGALNDRITAIGDGRARRAVTIRSQTTGRVDSIEFPPGAPVEKGAVIVRLENEAERIALESARIALDKAVDDVERLSRLEVSGTVSEVRFREAILARRNAELQVRQAEFDLSQRVIRAPIDGRIGIYEIEVGDRITAQDPLATVTDRSGLLIDFRVPERIIGQVQTGMAVKLRPLAQPGRTLTGHIRTIDTVVDRASRTLRIRAELDNRSDTLRPGMAFEVNLTLPGQSFPAVDPLAVQWSNEGSFVWAARAGKAVRVPVKIRQRNSDSVLVEGDLQAGEQVVIEGVQVIRPGVELRSTTDTSGALRGAPRLANSARRA